MQVGGYLPQRGLATALGAAAYGNPAATLRAAYQVGKYAYKEYKKMPKRKTTRTSKPRKNKKRQRTTKAPGAAGSLRQRRGKLYRKRRKCRTMSRRKLSTKVCKLSHSIRPLYRLANASTGTFVHRKIDALGPCLTGTDGKTCGVTLGIGLDMKQFGDTGQYLKYYNPATPQTLTVASVESGTFDRRFLFTSIYSGVECTNNYQSNCKLKVYLCIPKQSGSLSPLTAWADGVDSNGDTSITDYKQIGQYPNDYSDTRDLWTIKLKCKASLAPGQSMSCHHAVKNVEYDPTAYTEHTALYQSKYKNFMWMFVVEGTTAHTPATPATAIGLQPAGVDIKRVQKRTVKYDAGVNIKFIKVENSLATGAASVASHQPIPDNVTFADQ